MKVCFCLAITCLFWLLTGCGGPAVPPRPKLTPLEQARADCECVAVQNNRILLGPHDLYLRISSAAFSPDGRQLLAAAASGHMYLWSLEPLSCLHAWELHSHLKYSVAFAPDGKTCVAGGTFESLGSHDGTYRESDLSFFDTSTGEHLRRLNAPLGTNPLGGTFGVNSLEYSPDGQLLALRGVSSVRVLDAQTDKMAWQAEMDFVEDGTTWDMAFSPQGDRLAVVTQASFGGSKILVWTLLDGQRVLRVGIPDVNIKMIRFAPDSSSLVCGTYEGLLFTVDATDGRRLREFRTEHAGDARLLALDVSSDGRFMATARSDTPGPLVDLWDFATGQHLGLRRGLMSPVRFSAGGQRLAVLGHGHILVLPSEELRTPER